MRRADPGPRRRAPTRDARTSWRGSAQPVPHRGYRIGVRQDGCGSWAFAWRMGVVHVQRTHHPAPLGAHIPTPVRVVVDCGRAQPVRHRGYRIGVRQDELGGSHAPRLFPHPTVGTGMGTEPSISPPDIRTIAVMTIHHRGFYDDRRIHWKPAVLRPLRRARPVRWLACYRRPSGRRMTNRLPCPTTLSASMDPPWASTSLRAMVSPSPVPPVLREREGSAR